MQPAEPTAAPSTALTPRSITVNDRAAPTLRDYLVLGRYATAHWRGWATIFALTSLGTVTGLLQPWPLKLIVDHVIGNRPRPEPLLDLARWLPGTASSTGLLLGSALAVVGIYAINSLLDVLLTVVWIRVGYGMVYELSADMLARLQRRSLVFHSRNAVGDSVSRITDDCWCVHTIVDSLLFGPAQALASIAGMLLLMLALDPLLTAVAFAAVPLTIATSWLLGRPIRRLARERRKVESALQANVQRVLRGIAVVQAFGQEPRAGREFRGQAAAALGLQRRSARVRALSQLSSGLLATSGMALILSIGAGRIHAGQATLGTLLVFLAYFRSLDGRFRSLKKSYTSLQGVSASVERVAEVLRRDPDVKTRPGALKLQRSPGDVRFEAVSFGYEPDRLVLKEVSLHLPAGGFIALVGESGAGKSTLAGLLPRFFDPVHGRVLLDGHDVRDLELSSLRAQISLVLQEPFLFPTSIAENIAFGRPSATQAEIEAAAKAAHAHGFIARLPDGYATVLGEQGGTLSGGERQRIAIARALLRSAPILILDEPTSALDSETEAQVMDATARLTEGRTTLVIAHRLSTAKRADLIAVMRAGTIIEIGTHAELSARDGDYARLLRAQRAGQNSLLVQASLELE